MKQDWKYKKLGDVANIIGGSTPKTDIPEYWDGGILWVTPAELYGSKYISVTQRTITQKAVDNTNLYLLPKGTVLLSSRAPIGKVCITTQPMYSNQGFKSIVCGSSLYNEFIYYYLLGSIDYLQSLGTGATFKEISKKVVEQIIIPIPPYSEQQKIVSELDLLCDIIEKQKTEIKELEKLSLSIYYDMFGDPVSNEKNWEIKTIGEIASFYNGKAHEKVVDEKGEFILVNSKFIASKGEVIKRTNHQLFPLLKDDIVMVMSDVPNGRALASCYLIEADNTYSLNQRICAFRNYSANSIFLFYTLNRNSYYLRFDDGNGQTNLRKDEVINCPVIFPPLALQQQFASKIESIDAMKAKVRLSLKETEQLFNSRMDYYFK